MKKNTLLTLVLALFIAQFSIAQTAEELAKSAAAGLCDCVNDTYSNIDRDVKESMIKIIQYQVAGQEAEMEKYASTLSADLLARIETQAAMFQENEGTFQLCIEDLELQMAHFTLDSHSNITEDQLTAMIFKNMKDTRGCRFANMLVELGLSEANGNNNNNNTKNDDNNGKNNNSVNNKNNNNNNSGGDEHGSGGN